MQSAAKVGALVVTFVVLIVAAFAILGRSLFAASTSTYYAEFADAAGVKAGTPVLMAGVKIGEVQKIELATPRKARATLVVAKDAKIPTGSAAVIPSSLVGIGESPIQLEPPAGETTTFLPAGATLAGRKGGALDNVLPNAEQTVAEMTKTLAAVRKLLEDRQLQGQVKTLMATTDKTLQQFGSLAARMEAVVGQNQSGLQTALLSVNRSLADVNRITAQAATMLEDPRLRKDALAILSNVKGTTAKVDRLVADLGKALNDPKMRTSLQNTVANVEELTNKGKTLADTSNRIADNAERITANGAVISEKAIGVTEKIDKLASQASDIASDVKTLTNRVSGILSPKARTNPLSNVQVGMDLFRESRPGYWRTDFSAKIPFKDNELNLGLYDAFESNKLTLQLGNRASPSLTYRYGIFAGRAGVGVDYLAAPRLFMRGDLWNLNEPRLDVRAGYEFGNGLIGWFGVDRLFKENAPTIGIGIRR